MQDLHRYTHALEQGIKERTGSLEKSMSIMRATFESSTDGILVIDKSGILIDHNDKIITMCHINQSLLDTKNFQKIVEHFCAQTENSTNFQKTVNNVLHHDAKVMSGKLFFRILYPKL